MKPNKLKDTSNIMKFPMRYLPKMLDNNDKKKQVKMLVKSQRLYKKGIYYTRDKVASFKSKKSNHIANARKIYKIENISPTKELAVKTGCKLEVLKKIVQKGEGAYYSSGSRPNQTAQSWGLARLASALTSGKAAAVDYNIIRDGCDHKKKAFILANKSNKKYKLGHGKTKKATIDKSMLRK
jgi:predicted GTPase